MRYVPLCVYVHQINPRLQRHFVAFAIGMPSPTSLLVIFETFLEGHLRQDHGGKRFQAGVMQVCPSLIKGALSVHQEVSQLAPAHHRNLTRLVKGEVTRGNSAPVGNFGRKTLRVLNSCSQRRTVPFEYLTLRIACLRPNRACTLGERYVPQNRSKLPLRVQHAAPCACLRGFTQGSTTQFQPRRATRPLVAARE